MSDAKTTKDHAEIRAWAEARGGHPSSVSSTQSGDDAGILRLDFDPKDDELSYLSWDDFFRTFDEKGLSFLYQDETKDGERSRFHKFVRE